MEQVKIIKSAQGKPQIINNGFLLVKNRGPHGPYDTTYFSCLWTDPNTNAKCKATAATLGSLDGDTADLKFHRLNRHIHEPDETSCSVRSAMAEFRESARNNVDLGVKQVYEDLTTELFSEC
jgi:hypothetical protein